MSTNVKLTDRQLTRRLNKLLDGYSPKNLKDAQALVKENVRVAMKAARHVKKEYQYLVSKWATEAIEELAKQAK